MPLLAQIDGPTLYQTVLVVWQFCIGAAIGSFLNVVIYRVPLGISVVYPPSHCPRCKRPIRAYDNLPILSWLILRGRCRQCGARFSGRYALVELGIALLFACFTALVLAPRWPDYAAMENDPEVMMAWFRWGLFAASLAALWTAALIERDGHRSSAAIPLVVICFSIAPVAVMPAFYDFAISIEKLDRLIPRQFSGALGLVLGAVVVALLSPKSGNSQTPRFYRKTAILWAAAMGAVFGWQVVLAGALAAAVWFAIVRHAGAKSRAHRRGMQRLVAGFGLVSDHGASWLICFAEMQTLAALLAVWYGMLHSRPPI